MLSIGSFGRRGNGGHSLFRLDPTVLWVGLQFVIVVFPDHTHLLFDTRVVPIMPRLTICLTVLFADDLALQTVKTQIRPDKMSGLIWF